MSNGLVQKRKDALQRITDNASAIYDVLDAERGPVKVADIQKRLKINGEEYRRARQHLTAMPSNDVYITQDGLVLTRYVQGMDQRFWHLAWSLGLLEVSGQQLVMDEDLLAQAPAALTKAWNQGKIGGDPNRLRALQGRARERVGTLLKLADMYKRIDRQLGLFLLPYVSSRDWNQGLREIRNQLGTLP
ncbi:MAG TPA: hypothetical protein VEH50_12130 [Methylomirabilota bacterium]|nr:hypothetical protein [Methylomirabilota bacterium]